MEAVTGRVIPLRNDQERPGVPTTPDGEEAYLVAGTRRVESVNEACMLGQLRQEVGNPGMLAADLVIAEAQLKHFALAGKAIGSLHRSPKGPAMSIPPCP
jgi:hypothetical protein